MGIAQILSAFVLFQCVGRQSYIFLTFAILCFGISRHILHIDILSFATHLKDFVICLSHTVRFRAGHLRER